LLAGAGYGPFLTSSEGWDPSLESKNGEAIDALTPAPVAVGDLLVYFNPHGGAFEARSIRRGADNFGEVLWRSAMHRRKPLSYLSSPMAHESLLFVVTDHPNYVHRIAVSTGARQICRIQLNGATAPELPGDLLPQTPPLLFDLPERTANQAGVAKVLVVLTTEGICILDVPSLSLVSEPVLRGAFFPVETGGDHRWTRPARVGSYIVATSSTSPTTVLCIDVTNYPRDVTAQTVPLRRLLGGFARSSPCIGIQDAGGYLGSMACWYVVDDQNRESRLVFFRPPCFYDVVEIPFTGSKGTYGDLEDCLGPVTDGAAVYVPYLYEKANTITMGLTMLTLHGWGGKPVSFPVLPSPGVSPLFAAVAQYRLVYPDRSHLCMLDVRVAEPKPVRCGTFVNNGAEVTCWSRPIVVGSRVFVQGPSLISSFELGR
jgi:hypothetical protein